MPMTYCVGIDVDEGLVFAADTRTNASVDDVRVHRKLHVFEYPGEAVFVLMASGNLATTQLLVSRLQRDVEEQRTPNLRSLRHLFEVAEYVGALLVTVPAAYLLEDMHVDWSFGFFATLAWSVLGISMGAIALLLYLIRRGDVSKAASLIYLVPPLAALEAAIAFGEELTVPMMIETLSCPRTTPPPRLARR